MKKIIIDVDLWTTPQQYADELHLKNKQVVYNWIRRDKIEYKFIPELNLHLVKRGTHETEI